MANNISSELRTAPREIAQACFLPISPDGNPLIGAIPGAAALLVASYIVILPL